VGKVVQWVAAGGRRLAGQVVVSIVATAAAAFIVPPLVDRAAPGLLFGAREKPAAVQVVAPEYFEAAFLWPAAAPPASPQDLEPPQATLPAIVPVPSRPQRQAQAQAQSQAGTANAAAARRNGTTAQRPAAPAPATPPGAPLELASMIAPKPPAPEKRTLLGIPVPPLPYEQAVAGTLAKARDAVRSLF